MGNSIEYPPDFRKCVDFHGHVCPGLAIGYGASMAGMEFLGVRRSEDEELVAIVENDSCAVDAIQALTGCTFGKGNLIFRDWGKQVYTFFDRSKGKAVRISLKNRDSFHSDQRRTLREKINKGTASETEKQTYDRLKEEAVLSMIQTRPGEIFRIEAIDLPTPQEAGIMETRPCKLCGEETVTSKMVESQGHKICLGCQSDQSEE